MTVPKAHGLHEHRFRSNPEEHRFAEAWALEQDAATLDYLMGDGAQKGIVSIRDQIVAATLMQWLGSPVGQSFLRDLGYERKP